MADLREQLQREDTNFKKAIAVEKKVAICLYYFGHGPTCFNLSEKFCIGESTAHGIVKEFMAAVLRTYSSLVGFPEGERLKEVIKGFEAKRQLPTVVGPLTAATFGL